MASLVHTGLSAMDSRLTPEVQNAGCTLLIPASFRTLEFFAGQDHTLLGSCSLATLESGSDDVFKLHLLTFASYKSMGLKTSPELPQSLRALSLPSAGVQHGQGLGPVALQSMHTSAPHATAYQEKHRVAGAELGETSLEAPQTGSLDTQSRARRSVVAGGLPGLPATNWLSKLWVSCKGSVSPPLL